MTPDALTPIERHAGQWLKRDDLFAVGGQQGGKVRTCLALAETARERGLRHLVTAGSRHSPQVAIVAAVGRRLGMAVTVVVPAGDTTPEIEGAAADGATVMPVRPGHNAVIVARAREHAAATAAALIPFGMECEEAVMLTAAQVANVPADARRIVVPVGSGMSLAGILTGLDLLDRDTTVLGVCVGADPTRRLARWAPLGWQMRTTLVAAGVPYHLRVEAGLGAVGLDPVYEAKCVPFLAAGDVLWVVGRRG